MAEARIETRATPEAETKADPGDDSELGRAWEALGFLTDRCLQLAARCRSGSDTDRVAERLLLRIAGMLQSVGTEREWRQLIRRADYAAAARVVAFLSPLSPAGVVCAAARILVLFCSLEPLLWERQPPEALQPALQGLLGGASAAHGSALGASGAGLSAEQAEQADEDLRACLLCLRDLFAAAIGAPPAAGCASRQRAIADALWSSLRASQVARVLFASLRGATEATFLVCVQALLAAGASVGEGGMGNGIVAAIAAAPDGCHLVGEGLLHTLNNAGTPDRSRLDVEEHAFHTAEAIRDSAVVLRFCAKLLRERASAAFLLTNDLMVLVDILLRALGDLPAEEPLRLDYLGVLELLLLHSAWHERGAYRGPEILAALEELVEKDRQSLSLHGEGGGHDIAEGVVEKAEAVMVSCLHLLE